MKCTIQIRMLVFSFTLMAIFALPAHGQIPGTKDIIKEFPEFTSETDREQEDIIDFEFSRLVGIAFHGNFDFVVGGISKIMENSARGTFSLEYFMTTQTAAIVQIGFSRTTTKVAGQTTVVFNGANEVRDLSFDSEVDLMRGTLGFRFYLGHPAFPSFLYAVGLHAELGGGAILRREKFKNGVLSGGLTGIIFKLDNVSDINPAIYINLGFEIPLVDQRVYLGGQFGYTLAFLSGEGEKGKAGEDRDGDWATIGIYVMAHLF